MCPRRGAQVESIKIHITTTAKHRGPAAARLLSKHITYKIYLLTYNTRYVFMY